MFKDVGNLLTKLIGLCFVGKKQEDCRNWCGLVNRYEIIGFCVLVKHDCKLQETLLLLIKMVCATIMAIKYVLTN